MENAIYALYDILNKIKGFNAGYSSDTVRDGKMLIEYANKRYVLELREVKDPSKDMRNDLLFLKYL